jgi:DNA helicase-2/ATP-dependent DNA helicase PcrA
MTATLVSPSSLILQGLNDQQLQAVNHTYGPLLVAAGAGAGKTGVLTRRIAMLLVDLEVDPRSMLVSTFTKKAADEMKERLNVLLCGVLAHQRHETTFTSLSRDHQRAIADVVREDYIKPMLIGTLHSCFGQILRKDIESYVDPEGLSWTRRYKIADSSDQAKIMREIVSKQLNLDPKIYSPRTIASQISRMKNNNVLPDDMIIPPGQEGRAKRVVFEAYKLYRRALAQDNTLDFDDILMVTARLLKQNETIRRYWHQRFRHLLVDEYQDTNTAQFDVLRMIATGQDQMGQGTVDWSDRSFFVVGDVDQAIYSFRGADYQIMLDFQKDFGDGLMTKDSQTMILLEKNYRSTQTIIHAANHLIQNNQFRVDKTLEPTRDKGEPIRFKQFAHEDREAEYIAKKIKQMVTDGECQYSDVAILYRNNSISRPFESEFVRRSIPHVMPKSMRFFERKEIKDLMAYLQFVDDQTSDSSLVRILGVPKRGVGDTTIEKLKLFAYGRDMSLWDLIHSPDQVKEALGRANKGLSEFVGMIQEIIAEKDDKTLVELLHGITERIEYTKYLQATAVNSDEAFERQGNVNELFNAIAQHVQDTADQSIAGFLEAAALQLEAGSKTEDSNSVTLLTIHGSKGLEFPIVFIAGVEDDIIPSYRALQTEDPEMLEEERRLFYVAITRAKNQLYLSAVKSRSNGYGGSFDKVPSMFLDEIPDDYILSV